MEDETELHTEINRLRVSDSTRVNVEMALRKAWILSIKRAPELLFLVGSMLFIFAAKDWLSAVAALLFVWGSAMMILRS